ncbi:glycosyltransferase family 4 protein [bacterium]|nr:glycosyltransferase family 4 protein [bacterium]
MKIAFDHLIFLNQRFGGVSRYLVRLMEQLRACGEEVFVTGLIHQNSYLNDFGGASRKPSYVSSLHPRLRRLSYEAGVLRSGAQLKRDRPDVLHESFYGGGRVGSKSLPRICTIHDMIHEIYPELADRDGRVSRIKRETVRRSDLVICISEQTKSDLIRFFGTSEEKIRVVYHGAEWFEGEAEIPQIERPFILYVGARSGYKNFDTLLEGYASDPAIHSSFDLLAFGGGGFNAAETAKIGSLGLVGKVRQLGGSDALLAGLYRNAKIFAYPSSYEGFGLPPLEAMSMDCPVIASNQSCIPEIVGDAAILVDPHSQSAWASALNELLTSEDKCDRLRAAGHSRLKMFRWEKCAEETLKIYQEIS